MLLYLGMCQSADPRQRWIRVTTDHFEMYTDNSEKQAVNALQIFEQVRFFFLKNSKHPLTLEGKVRIIAFSSENDYKPYRLNAGAFAFYAPTHQRDYIVMQDIQREHHQAAVHEYTHLIVNHLKLEPPIWLNEGMADLYSSLEPEGKKAMVGRPLPGHEVTLITKPWMDWGVLFAVDHQSPYYNQPDKMEIFYAQSWVLTHMLTLSPDYAANFPRLLMAVSNGMPTAEALQKIYGKSTAEVGADVQKYVHQNTVRAAIYDVTLSKSDLEPQVEELSDFDKELALAELLSAKQPTAPEAQRRLLALEQQRPNSVELEVSLGYLSWQRGDLEQARKHFRVAADAGLKDPKVLYDYAQLLQGTSDSTDLIANLLTEVLAAQPENLDARLFLAGTLTNARRYGKAYATLADVHNVPAERAFDLFALQANARANLKDYKGAKLEAQRALEYAKTEEQKERIEQLTAYLDTVAQPPVAAALTAESAAPTDHVEQPTSTPGHRPTILLARDQGLPRVKGTTKALECGGGRLHLRLQVGNRDMVFELPKDPKDVLVQNAGEQEVQLQCGTLPPNDLTVVYNPSTDGETAGVIAELVY